MATISFNGASYTVDHAVKGVDYVHGYDANGVLVVSFEGVNDFSAITYDDTYLDAADCVSEPCNIVRYVNGKLQKADGSCVSLTSFVTSTMAASDWSGNTYSFEATYPKESYDIGIEVAPTATAEQFEAFGGAMICGSHDSNVATAIGDVPTVDIPIIIKVVAK